MEDGSGGGVSAPVFMGVRLFVGTTEGGMGPRMREDRTGGMGFAGMTARGHGGEGWVRMREDKEREGWVPNRPYGMGHGVTLFPLVTENNRQGPKVPICWERA